MQRKPQPISINDNQNGFRGAVDDLVAGFRMGPVWRTFAWEEIQSRYRRSVLGLAWIAVSYLLFVSGIAIIFNGLMDKGGAQYVHYVAIGYAVFTFLMSNLAEGVAVFKASATWVQSSAMPASVYVYKSVARALFPFLIQLSVALMLMIASGWKPTPSVLLVPISIFIILFTAVPVQLLFGLLGARARDVGHFVQSLSRLLIFLTPIIWTIGSRGEGVRQLALINPFTHYLEIVRAPLLGESILPESLVAVPVLTAVAWLLALVASSKMRKKLPFWI